MLKAFFAQSRGFSIAALVLAALSTSLVACSGAAEKDSGEEEKPSKPGKRENTADGPSGPTDSPTQGDDPVTPPPAPPAAPLIYAHTADTLYTFDATAKSLAEIGKLSCLSEGDRLLDIAVDGKGAVFGTTDEAFIAVNPADATCTRIIAKDNLPNSLSFVPAGTLDATSEALVGYAFDAQAKAVRYVRIDTTNGNMTEIGLLNPASATKKYTSSGDIFSVHKDGDKTYLTVREDPSTGSPDMLAEIDPKTGTIKSMVGNTLQRDIWGLAYWGGKAYGFSGDGNVTEINVQTGVSNLVTTLKDKDNVAVPWFGAGVTTEAPTTR
ncbi:MAG: hypothetical protein KF819_10800 [Labilithrix sp.]|nr:hypothetical protein [Labilithrix sp.]